VPTCPLAAPHRRLEKITATTRWPLSCVSDSSVTG
jgi:hypothetical protein